MSEKKQDMSSWTMVRIKKAELAEIRSHLKEKGYESIQAWMRSMLTFSKNYDPTK